jgi:hypothetical protein
LPLCVSVIEHRYTSKKSGNIMQKQILRFYGVEPKLLPSVRRHELCNASEPSEIINQLSDSVQDSQNNSNENDNRIPPYPDAEVRIRRLVHPPLFA